MDHLRDTEIVISVLDHFELVSKYRRLAVIDETSSIGRQKTRTVARATNLLLTNRTRNGIEQLELVSICFSAFLIREHENEFSWQIDDANQAPRDDNYFQFFLHNLIHVYSSISGVGSSRIFSNYRNMSVVLEDERAIAGQPHRRSTDISAIRRNSIFNSPKSCLCHAGCMEFH